MIADQQGHFFTANQTAEQASIHNGLGYLFAAAVVNRQFREMLLNDPEAALRDGYRGQVFELSHEERQQITSVRARSLADLAKKMTLT